MTVQLSAKPQVGAALTEIRAATLPPLPPQVAKQAACRGLPLDWFIGVPGRAGYAEGRKVCASCPVMEPCKQWAREQPETALVGLWGGESRLDRRAFWSERARRRRNAAAAQTCDS